MHIITLKIIVLTSLVGLQCNYQPIQAFDYSDAITAAEITAVGTIIGGIGYCCYKIYETCSFNNACKRLVHNKRILEKIKSQEIYALILDDQHIINQYYNKPEEYDKLCTCVSHDVQILNNIQYHTDQDILTWSATEKAAQFVYEAEQFSAMNKQLLEDVSRISLFLNKGKILLKLMHLLDEEQRMSYYHIVYAAASYNLNETTARAYNPESAWPLRSLWKDLEQRKQLYKKYLDELGADCSEITQNAYNTVAAYENTQRVIAGFQSYTEDLRVEKDFELREEQVRQARIQAESARLAAKAQERQVHAQEQQICQQKEHELAGLRNELSILKQRIADGDNGYYIQQQKRQLQQRISDLKTELYGSASLFGIFLEALTDKD